MKKERQTLLQARRMTLDHYNLGLTILLVVLVVCASIVRPRFLTASNLSSMMTQIPEFGIMALGVMVAMITGGFDLSVVSVANLGAICAAKVMLYIMPDGTLNIGKFLLIVVTAIAIGILCGAINGILISVVKIPPMLATMGSNELLSGIALILTNGKAISGLPTAYSEVVTSKVFGFVPVSFLLFFLLAAAVTFLLRRTVFGSQLFLLGSNEKAAVFSGMKVKSVLIRTYMLSGALASVAGLVMLANYNSAKADYGSTYSMQCILICVLGGVSPTGGSGKVLGVMLAILILQTLSSGLNMFSSLNSFYRTLLWGAALLAVLVLNYYLQKAKAKRR